MGISRRTVFDFGLTALAAGVCPAVAHALSADPTLGPQVGDVFVLASDHSRRVSLDMLKTGGAPDRVWPMEPKSKTVRNRARFNQVLLLRMPVTDDVASALRGKPLAYTAICPHAGCVVSEWVSSTDRLHCPCHGSEYNPWNNGAVVAGPAPYPLPMLPVEVRDGFITVTGPFSAKPGGHTTRTM